MGLWKVAAHLDAVVDCSALAYHRVFKVARAVAELAGPI